MISADPHPSAAAAAGAASAPARRPFDVEAVRREFPILKRLINGRPLVYLDNAASAQKPSAVIDAMVGIFSGSYANVHRGLHTLANEATDAFEAARADVAALIGAAPANIVFTRGATEAINLVAAGLGHGLKAGDEVLLTELEHHANIVPWHFLRERKGVVLRFAPVREDGGVDLEAMGRLVNSRTRVVAASHMSNVTGARVAAAEVVRIARSTGAVCLIDGSQAVVHQAVDVAALGCDFYVFSGHKLFGPTGVGALYGRTEALEALPPYQGGGEMIAEVSLEGVTYAAPPHRFEAGTPAIAEAVALGAAARWLSAFDRDEIARHEDALYRRALEGLGEPKWLRILGTTPDKAAILSFAVEGVHAHDVAQILDRYGVAVRAGTHCAEPLLRRFGLASSARASFALYNTLEEADAFSSALIRARRFFD